MFVIHGNSFSPRGWSGAAVKSRTRVVLVVDDPNPFCTVKCSCICAAFSVVVRVVLDRYVQPPPRVASPTKSDLLVRMFECNFWCFILGTRSCSFSVKTTWLFVLYAPVIVVDRRSHLISQHLTQKKNLFRKSNFG